MLNKVQFFIDGESNLFRYYLLEGALSDESRKRLDTLVESNSSLFIAHTGATFIPGPLEEVTTDVRFLVYENYSFTQSSYDTIAHMASLLNTD